MKGGIKKMPKKNVPAYDFDEEEGDEEEEENIEEEEEEEEQEVNKVGKVRPPKKPISKAKAIEDRYAPFRFPERVGIVDKQTNKTILEDENSLNLLLTFKAIVLNKLQRIEDAVC